MNKNNFNTIRSKELDKWIDEIDKMQKKYKDRRFQDSKERYIKERELLLR
jgi:hypothetical protein